MLIILIFLFRRLKNWIADRQQRAVFQQNLQGVQSPQFVQYPRQRNKSQGESDSGKGKKQKQQQQFVQAIKVIQL
jgi:hypothetical protein